MTLKNNLKNKKFKDMFGRTVIIDAAMIDKINLKHPCTMYKGIKKALLSPIEVRKSLYEENTFLFYSEDSSELKKKYCCVVAMNTKDEIVKIKSAYNTKKIKSGQVVYR